MFGFIKNLFRPKKSIEEIEAERKAFEEKVKLLKGPGLARVMCEKLGEINLKDQDAAEQIVYCIDKIYESGVTDALVAAAEYLDLYVLHRNEEELSYKIKTLWEQTKSYKSEMLKLKMSRIDEDF